VASREEALAQALDGLDPETRQALARALERGEVELEGGDWGSADDGSGCLLSLAAWELGLERGESLMRRSVAAVQVPALFDAWWDEVLTREGDVVRTRRSVREALGEMLFRGLAAPRDELPRGGSASDRAGVGATGDDGAVGPQVGSARVAARP
jgi:hypothetical protein